MDIQNTSTEENQITKSIISSIQELIEFSQTHRTCSLGVLDDNSNISEYESRTGRTNIQSLIALGIVIVRTTGSYSKNPIKSISFLKSKAKKFIKEN